MNRPRTNYAKCGDLHIAYQVFGDGPVDLLFAQGWMTNVEYAWESPDYARFLTKLSRFARVIFFDKRGVGLSDRNVGADASLDDRALDVSAVLDDVGSEKAALLGISEGGAISTFFATHYPDRVSHLLLYGSRPRYAWAPDWPQGRKQEEYEQYVCEMVENWGNPFPLTTGAPSVAEDPAAAEWFASYLRFSASPGAASIITRMNYDIDYRDLLPKVEAPTLVLHREGDLWCPVAHAHFLADHIEGALLRLLPGADHLPWYGDQDALIGEIREFLTGERKVAAKERVLLSTIFMDIANSTQKLAELGDDHWRELLEQLDLAVTRRVAAFAGKRVKHTGDGYLLAFSSPTAAIECASEVRRDMRRLGLECKTGVHTGECERRGEDLSGLAVHIAARIMDQADPGEIFVSRTVRDLVAGSSFVFESRGERPLKGLPDSWEVFSVISR